MGHAAVPSENWDDDFLFSAGNSPRASNAKRLSTVSQPRKRPSVALSETENWDEDFDHDENAAGPSSRPSYSQRRSKASIGAALENWDDEFEDGSPRQSTSGATAHAAAATSRRRGESWDSDDEPHPAVSSARRPNAAYSSDDDDDDDSGAAFGFAVGHDEDQTVTSSTQTRHSIPEVSTLPPHPDHMSTFRPVPVPGSPTLSSFSATLSYHAPSQYSSTHHLALRPTVSAGSSNHAPGHAFAQHPGVLRKPPPSTSQNPSRARRRLRKKSRPSRPGEDIYEMDDRMGRDDDDFQRTHAARLHRLAENVDSFTSTEDELDELPDEDGPEHGDISPITPEPRHQQTHSRPLSVASNSRFNKSNVSFQNGTTPSSAIPVSTSSPPDASVASSLHRTPLLQRLGSVRRWAQEGARRLSVAPSEMSAPSANLGTDFEPSFGYVSHRARIPSGEAKKPNLHELLPTDQSKTHHQSKRSTSALHPDEPSRSSKSWFFHRDKDGGTGGGGVRGRKSRDKLKGPPGTMHAGQGDLSGLEDPPSHVTAAVFPRHESGAGPEDLERDHEVKERRGILGSGLRRISLIGGHKRHKSNAEESVAATPAIEPTSAHVQMANFQFPPPSESGAAPTELMPSPQLREIPPSPPQHKQHRHVQRLAMSHSEPLVISTATASSPNIKFVNPGGQAASLGRNGALTLEAQRELAVRRNSLGDLKGPEGGLKIPARISRAQVNLKRDLLLVKEFAACVDVLQRQQDTYRALFGELGALAAEPASATSVSTSSTRLFHLPRAPVRHQADVDPNHILQKIEHEYSIWWECADILIELGGKPRNDEESVAPTDTDTLPPSGRNTPRSELDTESLAGRGRALTVLAAQNSTALRSSSLSSPPNQWRASAGRHDLNQRQLHLLKKMLDTPDPSTFVVGGVAIVAPRVRYRESATTLAADTTVNSAVGGSDYGASPDSHHGVHLPHIDSRMRSSSPAPSYRLSPLVDKVRRGSRGIAGLRDILRSFRRHARAQASATTSQTSSIPGVNGHDLIPTSSAAASSLSISAHDEGIPQRKLCPTTGAQVLVSEQEKQRQKEMHPNSPYGTVGATAAKTIRRPSLASLFRLASGKSKQRQRHLGDSVPRRSEDPDSSDWDRMESASEPDLPSAHISAETRMASDTVRGRKKVTYEALAVAKSATVQSGNLSRPASRNGAASGSQSSVNLVLPSTPLNPGRRNRMFGAPGSRDGGAPPPAPSQAYAHAAYISGASRNHSDATPKADPEAYRRGRERSATDPARPVTLSHSASTNNLHSTVPTSTTDALPPLPDLRLAVTPENILPLLEYAKEVHTRLNSCVAELRSALPRYSTDFSAGNTSPSVA
ncbi:hypothetical protein BKA62DRAFT_250362 [Auriculariales sp. MPI-PUGE-AT-0066]|nr:hypothetical protein BKA62DRAFT_250362 [Auriculariales sp. MPI-PUGE-AT-0066]